MNLKLKSKMALAFLAYSLRMSRVPVGPLFVTLETGNKCNLRCPMCPQSTRGDDFPEGTIPLDEFEKLLRRIDRFSPIACLTLHLSAEPTLHPQLPRMLELSREILGLKAGFASNAFSLTKPRGEKIVDAGIGWITFDFCADKEEFEKNRFPAKWERTYRNMVDFLETIVSRGEKVTVLIKNVDWRPDDGESLQRLKDLFRGLPVTRFQNYQLHNWSGDFAGEASSRLHHSFLTGGTYHPCSHLWFQFIIAYDGKIHLCCRDTEGEHIIADTSEAELEDIWNGEEFRRLRKLHAQKRHEQIPACADCDRIWTGGYSGGTPFQMVQRNVHRIFQ